MSFARPSPCLHCWRRLRCGFCSSRGFAAAPSLALLQTLEGQLNSGKLRLPLRLLSEGPRASSQRAGGACMTPCARRLPRCPLAGQVRARALRMGRSTVQIKGVSGSRSEGPYLYRLEAEQLLALGEGGGRLNGQK